MPTKSDAVKPIPEGYCTVTPWITSRGTAKLIDFVKQARVHNEDGTIGHAAEVRIDDSVVMMFDAGRDWPDTPAFLRLYVEDGDALFQQALNAGATSVTKMTTLSWGNRVGRVRDPLGNVWWIQTRVEDLSPEEIEKRAAQREYIDAMRYVQTNGPY